MPTVTIKFVTFNIWNEPLGGRWNSLIRSSFQTAANIFSGPAFGSQPIRLSQGPTIHLSQERSINLLTENQRNLPDWDNPTATFKERLTILHNAGVAEYQSQLQRGVNEPHRLNAEHFADVTAHGAISLRRPTLGMVRGYDSPLDGFASAAAFTVAYANYLASGGIERGTVTGEALRILDRDQIDDHVWVYCVPGIGLPSTTSVASTASSAFFSNVNNNEGIFMGPNICSDTLAHELVHLLGRVGHCATPVSHLDLTCECATTNNLMYHTGPYRTDNRLAEEQVSVIRRNGTRYIT
jgi:hypothetical protein